MARANKPIISLDTIFFSTPEQKLLRFLMSEPTTSFTPRVLSSRLKGVRGLGGAEGIQTILKNLSELGMVLFLNNNREICLQNEHPAIQQMKVFSALCDLEGLITTVQPMSTKGIIFGSRATGRYRTDSNYNLAVVTESCDEVINVVRGHPLVKKIDVLCLTPEEYHDVDTKQPELARHLNSGIVLWGSSW